MTVDETLLARLRDGDDLSARIEAADCLEAQARKIARLTKALEPFAERHTIAEIMAGASPPEWLEATPERRIEMMGERKRANDAAILEARSAIAEVE